MVCEVGRLPYVTKIRPFRGDDREVEIVWYPAVEGARPLPFPTTILSRYWQASAPDWAGTPPYPDRVGEVIGARRTVTWTKTKPDATGQRWCGNPTDFTLGCDLDEDAPPVVRRDDGIPVCCGWALVPLGGIGVGGEAEMGVEEGPPGNAYYVPAPGGTRIGYLVSGYPPWSWAWPGISFPTTAYWLRSPTADPTRPYWWVEWPSGTRYIAQGGASWDGQGNHDFDWDPTSPFHTGAFATETVSRYA